LSAQAADSHKKLEAQSGSCTLGKEGPMEKIELKSENSKVESKVPQDRHWYVDTFDNMLEGCQVIGFDWRYHFVNKALTKQCDKSKEELLGKRMMDVFPGIERTVPFKSMQVCMNTRVPQITEGDYPLQNGQHLWIIFSIEPVPEGIFVLSLDITRQKQAEHELVRKNRILQIVRNINQSITQKSSAQELLDSTCRDFIEVRSFRRCWAIQLDTRGKVVLTAESGIGGSFKKVSDQLKEGILSNCFKLAIETGQAVIVREGDDICKGCPRYQPIVQNTFTIIVPMKYGGKTLGVLGALAGENIILNDEEVGLFQQLANDLGFALNNLELEKHRVLAEQALVVSEERFRRISEVAQDLIYRIKLEPEFSIDYVSPSIRTILGYTLEEAMDDTQWLSKTVYVEDRGIVQGLLISHEVFSNEPYITRWVHKDGHLVWIESRSSIIRDDTGKISGLIGIGRDVSDRVKMEEALKQSEAFNSTLLANSPNPIVLSNLDTSIRYVNPAFEALTGFTDIEVIGTKLPYPWWPAEVSNQYLLDKTWKRDDETFNQERLFQKKNGERFRVEIKIRKIMDKGELKYFLSNWNDITERKEAEELSRLDEARFESLLKIAQFEDPSIQNLLDFTLQEAIKLTRSRFGHVYQYDEDSREFTLSSWSREMGEVRSLENPRTVHRIEEIGIWAEPVRRRKPVMINDHQPPDPLKRGIPAGRPLARRFLTIPVFIDRKIVAVVGVSNKETDYDQSDLRQLTLLMDSTWKQVERRRIEIERKLAAEEMEQLYIKEKSQRQELQEEARARGLFVDVLAHELRTPLTPILASTSMMKDLLSEQKENIQTRLATNIYNSTQTLAHRLEELLDMARYSRGTFKLNMHLVDLNKFLIEVITRFKPVVDQRGQTLKLDIQADLPQVVIDPSRLEQVIINLLSNASKFSPEKGNIFFKTAITDNGVLIEIQDEGIGITPEEQARLFQPYHRVEQDRQKFPGIGLGLAVAKQIIEAHGGKIWLTSKIGQGSTFSICFPLRK
jgi:two-component system, OmpR family, phosphate regulon sensor histidine kinase PhoR